MKRLIIILSVLLAVYNCSNQQKEKPRNETVLKPQLNEDGEYDLTVLDSQYDYFLSAIARPMNFYSVDYLKAKNRFLVSEWNSLYFSGKYRNVIESSIDYDPEINYGLTFEYRLYQVFAYVSWKYGLKLNGLSPIDSH